MEAAKYILQRLSPIKFNRIFKKTMTVTKVRSIIKENRIILKNFAIIN